MRIRTKALIIILIPAVLFVISIYYLSNTFLINNLLTQESKYIEDEMDSAFHLLKDTTDNLSIITGDWAAWDETFYFVMDINDDYIQENLNYKTISNLQVDAIVYVDKGANIRYSVGYDTKLSKIESISADFEEYITKNIKLLCSHETNSSIISGIISLDKGPMLISSRPITDSKFLRPSSGTLIMGKYIDDRILHNIENKLHSKIEIESIENFDKSLINGNHGILTRSKDSITRYYVLKGLKNEPLYILKLVKNRIMFKRGIDGIKLFVGIFILFTVVATVICIIFLQLIIINPVLNISNAITKINLKKNLLNKIHVDGRDELSRLGNEINFMLDRIDKDSKKMVNSEKQLKLVLEGANAGFWDWDIMSDRINLSPIFLKILGYSEGELPFCMKQLKDYIYKDDIEYFMSEINKTMNGLSNFYDLEQRLLARDGTYKWVLNRASVVEYDGDKPKRIAGLISDISDKKKYEERIVYLSYYDKLTGLNNRAYLEDKLEELDVKEKVPFTIVIGDINGLKITNDTLGHEEGDKLLVHASDVLKKSCREHDIIARWGGDEFAAILIDADESIAESICKRIKQAMSSSQTGTFSLSISLGYSTKSTPEQNVYDIIKQAEERMYRNKLLEGKSFRNGIIASLEKSLEEKSIETEQHTRRMRNISAKIGKKLNMNNSQIDELTLLASLHDIGKISIPESILNKNGKLDEVEWEIMKTHSEAGFRIASSSYELRHIAYSILCHHENFDGTGYPGGLKGNDIPLVSRIIRIVDSFDVMTHERPYKKAMSMGDAFKELKTYAGKQFDPELVDICIEVYKDYI